MLWWRNKHVLMAWWLQSLNMIHLILITHIVVNNNVELAWASIAFCTICSSNCGLIYIFFMLARTFCSILLCVRSKFSIFTHLRANTGWGKWLKINSNYFYWMKKTKTKNQYQHWHLTFRDWITNDFAIQLKSAPPPHIHRLLCVSFVYQ